MSAIGRAKIADILPFYARFIDEEGDEVSTGTCETRAIIRDGGVTKFLQADGVTFDAADHAFANTHVPPLGFGKDVTVPAAADDHILILKMTHEDFDYPDEAYYEAWGIGEFDEDDLQALIADIQAATAHADIDFLTPTDPEA